MKEEVMVPLDVLECYWVPLPWDQQIAPMIGKVGGNPNSSPVAVARVHFPLVSSKIPWSTRDCASLRDVNLSLEKIEHGLLFVHEWYNRIKHGRDLGRKRNRMFVFHRSESIPKGEERYYTLWAQVGHKNTTNGRERHCSNGRKSPKKPIDYCMNSTQ